MPDFDSPELYSMHFFTRIPLRNIFMSLHTLHTALQVIREHLRITPHLDIWTVYYVAFCANRTLLPIVDHFIRMNNQLKASSLPQFLF